MFVLAAPHPRCLSPLPIEHHPPPQGCWAHISSMSLLPLRLYNSTSASLDHYAARGKGSWWQVVWPLLTHILSDNQPNTINDSKSASEARVTFVAALSPSPQQRIIAVCTNPCL